MESLFQQPPDRLRRLLSQGVPAYLCVNPIEYHGPHLSLRNDGLVCMGLAADLHARMRARRPDWDPFLVHALDLGSDAIPGPGSQHTPPSVLRARLRTLCRALVQLGARHVVLLSFHGAPTHVHALESGVRWLRRQGVRAAAPTNRLLEHFVLPDTTLHETLLDLVPDAAHRRALRPVLDRDFHAGFGETSMALLYAPASVAPVYRALPPCPEVRPDARLALAARLARRLGRTALARELEFGARATGWYALRPFPGYTAMPALASATVGARLATMVLDAMEAQLTTVLLDGQAPPPAALAWVPLATLDGRLRRKRSLAPLAYA